MMNQITFPWLILLLTSSLLVLGAPVQSWNVFGPDQRKPMTSYDYPFRTIGYIDNTRCTGVLVGRDLVLTAGHCVLDLKTREIRKDLTYFRPNLINGKSYQKSWISHIWVGTRDLNQKQEDDWAILKLKESLGEGFGWMEIAEETKENVQCGGYSADFAGGRTPTLHESCQIVSEFQGILLHNCHATRGSSGSPIFIVKDDKAYIVGLNVGEFRGDSERSLFLPAYEEKWANTAVQASRFKQTVEDLRNK